MVCLSMLNLQPIYFSSRIRDYRTLSDRLSNGYYTYESLLRLDVLFHFPGEGECHAGDGGYFVKGGFFDAVHGTEAAD